MHYWLCCQEQNRLNQHKSTFLFAAMLLSLSNINNFLSYEKFSGTLGIKPGAAGSGSKYVNQCAVLLPYLVNFCLALLSETGYHPRNLSVSNFCQFSLFFFFLIIKRLFPTFKAKKQKPETT